MASRALRLDNGERLWMTSPAPCGTRRPCSPGQPGAVTVIPGAVFSGSLDGHIRGYSTSTGKVFGTTTQLANIQV